MWNWRAREAGSIALSPGGWRGLDQPVADAPGKMVPSGKGRIECLTRPRHGTVDDLELCGVGACSPSPMRTISSRLSEIIQHAISAQVLLPWRLANDRSDVGSTQVPLAACP